jgi:hypothetical protein
MVFKDLNSKKARRRSFQNVNRLKDLQKQWESSVSEGRK